MFWKGSKKGNSWNTCKRVWKWKGGRDRSQRRTGTNNAECLFRSITSFSLPRVRGLNEEPNATTRCSQSPAFRGSIKHLCNRLAGDNAICIRRKSAPGTPADNTSFRPRSSQRFRYPPCLTESLKRPISKASFVYSRVIFDADPVNIDCLFLSPDPSDPPETSSTDQSNSAVR